MALVLRPPTERVSLTDQMAEIGRARKRVEAASGVLAFVATAAGLTVAVGVLDAAVHLGAAVRALALVTILAAAGVVWLRGVVRPMRYRTDALAIALELENRFPVLNDALASAVSFLGSRDDDDDRPRPRSGVSNRLTASAVRVAERKVSRLPLDRLVPTGRCWRAAWVCALVAGAAVPLVLWNTARAGTALVRLADPFGAHPWPTKTRIEVLAPTFPARISKGDAFELKFAVRGVLTGAATVQVRGEGGGEFEEQFPLAMNNDPKVPGAAVITARFDSARVPATFAVRLSSNDGETDWLQVTVVPPPRLVPLDGRPSPQFHAAPPAYTNLPAVQLPDGAAVIEVPTGTVLRFRAATDVRLSAATLAFSGDRSAVLSAAPVAFLGHMNPLAAVGCQGLADALGADVPIGLSEDGRVLTAEFVPPLSGQYALRLTDDTGLTGTRLVEIRLTADPVPVVTLARPLAGYDPPLLAPTARVVVATAAEDKLYGVRRSFLEYRIGRDGPVRVYPLAEVPNVSGAALAGVGGGPVLAVVPQSGTVEANRNVPVTAFRRDDGTPVGEGDLLIIRAAADDHDDVAALKGPGRSIAEVEIRIASPEAIEAWLQKELAGFRTELIRTRDQQRDAKQKVGDVAPLPGGAVGPADRDRLVAAEQVQRQVRGKIGDARDGLRARADLLRATAQANALPKSNTTDRVGVVAAELDRVADKLLGTVEQELAEARQLAAQQPKPGREHELADALRKIERRQKDVEDTATDLIDRLAQWGGAGEIRSEARVLKDALLRQLAANEALKERVKEGKEKPAEDEQRDLDRAAAKAEQSAEQASQLISRAGKLADEKDKTVTELRAQAEARDKDSTDLLLRAAEQSNPVEKSALAAQANAAAAAATDLKAAAAKAVAEAAALRKGIEAAGSQGLADDLRQKAAENLRANRQGTAAAAQRAAVARLEALADALTETELAPVPELTKTKNLKGAADALNALADAQDELRKKTDAAARIADPEQRAAALKDLAKQQDRLIERGREALQRLARERADAAAPEARAALDRMEAARDDLEKGQPAGRAQAEAVDRLDTARDKLDQSAAQAGRQLSDEKRRKLADQVKSLVERQKAAVAEAMRIHGEAAREKGWSKPLLTSYSDLDTVREKEIAVEVRKLAETDFASLPVFVRILTDAAAAIDTAREKIQTRCDDADLAAAFDADLEAANDRKVSRPMALALRRLEQLADALKPDDPKKSADKKADAAPPQAAQNPPPNPNGSGEQDVVPPLAQLKALRALQADLNKETAQFAVDHPDPEKLTDVEKQELKELERAQREITELFEKMAQAFEKKDAAPPAKNAPAEKNPPEGKP